MPKKIYSLTQDDKKALIAGREDPNVLTNWFFRPKGFASGWQFDHNFTPKGAWQKRLCVAQQKVIVVIGGVASGKTLSAGMAAACWALTTESFRFLNVAQKQFQAEQMYYAVMERAQDTIFEKMITKAVSRPHPKIEITFSLDGRTYSSHLEFMSLDGDAKGILSYRGDWINIDEAGLLDNLAEVVKILSTRLTGSTRFGRPFLGRLSIISNPWDNPDLWELFDRHYIDPGRYVSYLVSTRDNLNVTEDQIATLKSTIPEDQWAQFLDGARPEGTGTFFSSESIYKCEQKNVGELVKTAVENNLGGYVYVTLPTNGVVHLEMPRVPGRLYFIFGDPGTDNAPARNSPVMICLDVTDYPTASAKVVAFWWGNGNQKIAPFVSTLIAWNEKYDPLIIGIDSTGPQKGTAELINAQHFYSDTNSTVVSGMDFSASKKSVYLTALRLTLEAGKISWPSEILGIRRQIGNYDPAKDRAGLPKIPQDIVATLAMAAFALRSEFPQSKDRSDVVEDVEVSYDDCDAFDIRYTPRLSEPSSRVPDDDDELVSIAV